MIKKYLLITIIIIVIIIIILHLNEFLKHNDKYQLLQVDKVLNNYRNYYLENLPIIFTNHINNDLSINHNMKKLISPLTVKNNYITNFYNSKNFIINRSKDKLFIIAEKNITLKLISPKELKKFSNSEEQHSKLTIWKETKKNYTFIEVKLYPGNIMYIPRNWLVNSSYSLNIYFTETIFSYMFKIYKIIPFL